MPVSGGPKGVAIGDLDGDGRKDIAVTQSRANSVTLFLSRLPNHGAR
jgi:hypothetical protein